MNGDPKKNRIEAYARLREQSLITFDDEQMEQLMSEEENRVSFHRFLLEKDATDFPEFTQWESKFFSDKKKVPSSPAAGEPSLDGSSGTSKPIEEAPESVDIRTVLESQGVMFKPQGGQPPTMPVEPPTEPRDETLSKGEPLSLIETIVEPAPLQAAPMNVPLYSSMLETRKARKDATITKIKESPTENLENPVTGYDILVADDDNKKLHSDPNTSDWTKGLLKARTFEDAADAVTERMGLIEATVPGDVMDRYSTVKAALIEISETGQLEGNQAAQQLFAEYSQILEENPGLAEYDELNAKAYSISQGYQNIRNTNPTYFTDIDRRKLMQDYADFKDKEKPKFVASVQAMGRAAGTELTNTLQGMLGTIAAFGNITGGRATTFDWADRLAEWSTRYLDPGLALPGPGGIAYGQPSKYQRSLFTNTARIRGFQVDIDSKGKATAVRDSNGYIVGDEDIRNDIIAEYEAAPDKYDVRYRPHLAPILTTAAGGAMQVLITSRFAGLGRTATAAKAIAAGQLTSRFAGQTYLQSLEEFGPENADIASRFAITTATLQSAVSLYINPLELRLSPKSFAVTNTTLRKIASDLNRGLSKDAALRNGVRYYAADLARYMKAYGADVGKESLEGAFEKAIDIAGRRIVRSATDINAEYDASLSSFIESMVSEGAGALFAAGGAIAQSNQWQQEQLMVAYENRDRILPMIKARYGEELVGKMQEVFDAADKRIVGVKTSREQKNQILLEEYHKITKPSANEGTAAMPPSEPVVPSQSEQAIPQAPAEEVAVAAKPSIYDIVRDEAREMRLEEGDTFVADGGIAYEVVSREENDVTIRSEDTGREYTFPISEVRADLTNKYQDIIAREHPTTDPVRLAGLRRAASRTISDENVTSPRQSVTPVNMTEAQQPAVPATEPTTPTESIAQAPIEPGVAKVGTQAPVFTMENIEQAEGVDGAAIKTLLQSISQIAPGIKVRIHESVEELSAEAGFKASAYIIGDHTIVISKESTLLDITHEVVHPIMAATELKTPGVTERFFDEIMTKLPGDIAGEMEGFRSKYGEESEETQRDEVVTEFLARIASGRYDESIMGNESIVDSMLRFFQSIFTKLGLTNPPTDVDSLRTFVKRIVPALQKGEVIELTGEVKGKTKGVKIRRDEFSLRNLLPQGFFKSADEDYKIENTKITLPESGKVFIDNEFTGKQIEAMYANYRNKNFLYSVIDADKQISDNFIPDNYNVYHGTNKVDIDSNGNLILRPSENFEGKTTSVSFTQIPAVALDYAGRKGGRYIVKIDNRAIKNYEVENHEEIAINTTKPVILPPGTFEVIKVYSFLDIKNLSEIDRIANKISKQSPYDIIDQYIQESYQLTSSQEIAEHGDDNAKLEEGDMPDDYMSYELINREAAKKALSSIPDVNIVSAISDHLKETGESFTSLGDLEGYGGVYGRMPFDEALIEFLGIKREDVSAIENAVRETIKARRGPVIEDEIMGRDKVKARILDNVNEKGELLESSWNWNEETGEADVVIGKEEQDSIDKIIAAAKSLDSKSFGNYWLDFITTEWDKAGRRATTRQRVIEYYFKSLIPSDELFASDNIQSAIKGDIQKRNLVNNGNVAIKAMNDAVVNKIDELGIEVLRVLADYVKIKYPNKNIRVTIGLQPISVAGDDGFRMTIPDVESDIRDMFPYWEGVIPAYQKLESQGVSRRLLWAAHDFLHEFGHTTGLINEVETDQFAVEAVKDFTSQLVNGTISSLRIGDLVSGVKARLTSSNMDVNYYRAKAWMKEEWGSPRTTMEADAVAMFGITPAQAGIMYEVLSKSPDVKNFSRPPGIEVRKGVWGILDKVGQLRNQYLLSSKGMPREVQIAMEMANGEEAVLAQTTVKGYNRIKKLLSKYDKADRERIKEIADRFIIGEATEAEILSLDKQLYYELLTIRSNLDEVTSAIMDEGSFSALRDEILAGNLGEYVNRAFRIHLSKNYTPDQAAIVAFRKEYKRLNGERITDELILEHMTKGIAPPTIDDIERVIQNNADNAMNTMLEENRPGKGGKAQASAGKPTGIMKERKAFAGAAGKLADWINDNPAGSVPPADMVDAARQSFIGDRTREAIHKHPEHKAEINRAIKEGDKLIKLATKLGVAVPTGNPFSAEGIRNAVTSGNPITWTVPATVPPADAIKMQAHINKINDSIATVVDAIQDRAEDDLVTVLLGKNRIDGTDGWRAQEHLLPGTRAILGEIPPLEAAVITMSKLANYYTVEKYYKLLKALGEGVFIFNANDIHIPVWATATIGAAGSERTSPLDGMKTAPEIAHILTQTEKFTGGVDLTVNWFQKINGFVQYNLTILSPRTQSRNFLSNIWFVVRNWWSDPVRATLALGVVPMDLIAMKASQGRIRLTPKHDALRDMSDSLAAALYQNFGKGFSQYNKITPADAGFGTTPDQVALFQQSLRWMRPKMSDKALNKADIIADAQATLGITAEQAHSLYSNLQPIGYNDYMGELVNKLAGAGLIGSSVSLRIIYDNIRQLNSPEKAAAFLTNSMLNDATNVADRAMLLARKGLKPFESAYGMSDDTFKIFGYLQERAKYASALFGKKYFELSDEQKAEVDNKAIEVTKNIIPNYNRLGALAKSISKNIFIGNFIAFKIESMRTWYNHLALAQKEITDGINSGNGRMVQMGGERMAGLLAATATQLGIEAIVYGMAAKAVPAGFKWIGGAVGSLLKAATGGGSDDEDEERTEMMRLLSPSFSAYDYLVMTKEPEEGKFTTVSVSANHPLGDFQRASNYALLGIQKHEPWSQVAFFTALQLMGNLADTKILVQILSETSSGEDSYGGRIWDETDSTDEKIKKSVQYAVKKAGPGITGQLSRLGWMDWVPSNEAFGWLHKPAHAGTAAEEAFGMATGFRPIVVDAYRVFQESIDSYVPGFGESGLQSSIFNDAQPNNVNISNAVFEEQIKGMVEKEWRFLRNLHRIYYLTTKYDITEADKMQKIMADQGLSYDPSNVTGRPFQIIATGKYSLPWNQLRKVEGRRMQNEKLKEPYQGISRELEAWLMEYEREVNQ